MIEFYLLATLCYPSQPCEDYVHQIHGTEIIQHFATKEKCQSHAFEDIQILLDMGVRLKSVSCVPTQGA